MDNFLWWLVLIFTDIIQHLQGIMQSCGSQWAFTFRGCKWLFVWMQCSITLRRVLGGPGSSNWGDYYINHHHLHHYHHYHHYHNHHHHNSTRQPIFCTPALIIWIHFFQNFLWWTIWIKAVPLDIILLTSRIALAQLQNLDSAEAQYSETEVGDVVAFSTQGKCSKTPVTENFR